MRRGTIRLAPLVVIPLTIGVAVTATNTVLPSLAGRDAEPAAASQLSPPQCASLTLTGIVTGSGSFSAGGGASLVLGSDGDDRIRGGGGTDCIVGGGGDDVINGGGGVDVCIGGPGVDTFRNCSFTHP